MFIFRPRFWGQFLTPKTGSSFFLKINFGDTKNKFRSHQFRPRPVRSRTWRGGAKLLADTLRMLARLGCAPSCARRRARPGTGVCALARAPACKRARARMHMHTLTYKCKTCKTGMLAKKEWMCTVRVRRSGPKSVPFADPRTWPIFCSVFLFAWGCFVRSCARDFL